MTTDIVERLSAGPAVLLLGQAYLGLETGQDPIAQSITAKFGTNGGVYEKLLADTSPVDHEAFLAWLSAKSAEMPIPDWMTVVSTFPWSALYTSAADGMWIQAFRNEWRELRSVFNELDQPEQPRNKLNLACTLLYGSATWSDIAPVPRTHLDMRRRSSAAQALLRRLPETVTPRGVLVIEGYDQQDWLSLSAMVGTLLEFSQGQVHLFSPTPELALDPDLRLLVDQKILTIHNQSLASVIAIGAESGRLQLGSEATSAETGHQIQIKNHVLNIPLSLWRKTSKSCVILDDSVLSDPGTLSPGARYHDFRHFLERSEGKPDWKGFALGYPFRRDFEGKLYELVGDALKARGLNEKPIVVHGSTGSGKTVSLAALAFRIRKEREFPVLYIPRMTLTPQDADLEDFVRWAEEQGAPAVLIVWDAMTSIEGYQELARFLSSRGRKCVVVGSLYRTESADLSRAVEVPRQLTTLESQRFERHLAGIDTRLATAGPSTDFITDHAFLVSLYRILPASRHQLREGVSREVSIAESQIVKNERTSGHRIRPTTALQWALADAGILELAPLLDGLGEFAGEAVTTIQRLTGLVMVPGQFNLGIPLELLLRTLGRETYEEFVTLLDATDVFEWTEDSNGNIEISPRTTLEAQIVVRARLGGAATEIDVICELIRNISTSAHGAVGREVEFASKLAQALHTPDRVATYGDHFRAVADALRDVRESRSVAVPTLMLQEAHLRREWAKRQEGDTDEQLAQLQLAQDVLEVAIDVSNNRQRHIRGNLFTEMASGLATHAVTLMRIGGNNANALRVYSEALQATESARSESPNTFYPLDVMSWATFDLVEGGLLVDNQRIEALADVAVALEISDTDSLNERSFDQLQKRRLQLGRHFGDTEMSEGAFQALFDAGSSAGVIFRAYEVAGGPRRSDWTEKSAGEAFAYIARIVPASSPLRDQKVRELSFDLWWIANAKEEIFERERVALPFTANDWKALLDLCVGALELGQSRRSVRLQFLRGVAEFHLQDYSGSFETLSIVEKEALQGGSRWNVIRSFVASSPDGAPLKYNGIIASVFDGGNRGEIYVESLRRRLSVRARDFGRSPLEVQASISDFHIAFSYQGAIADPVTAYALVRDRESPGTKKFRS